MYLFSSQETNSISCSIEAVSPTVRGWALDVKYDKLNNLNISNIATTFCRTDRKIFQIYKGIEYGSSEAMIFGLSTHSIIEKIYSGAIFGPPHLHSLDEFINGLKDDNKLEEIIWNGGKLQELRNLSANDIDYKFKLGDLKNTMREIIDFEYSRLSDPRLDRSLELIDLERYVSGIPLGISNGKVDAVFGYKGKIGIGDLKTGKPWKDNRDAKLQIAIYALLLESEVKTEVDWGVVIFPFDLVNGRRSLKKEPLKDIFGIGDDLRLEALQRLDDVNKMLNLGVPPEICYRCNTNSLCSAVL